MDASIADAAAIAAVPLALGFGILLRTTAGKVAERLVAARRRVERGG